MDSKDSSAEGQDSEHLQASVDFKVEKREEGNFTPQSSEREKEAELDSVVDVMDSDISNNEGSPPRAEAPTDYGTHSSWIYETFQPMEPIEIANEMHQSNQNVNKSSSDSSQIEPVVHQFYGMYRDVADNAATGDRSAYQHICGPTTSQPKGIALASSSSFQSSYQQFGENLANIGDHRRIKNRQAAKESRRRKKAYLRHLEDRVYLLEMQNKSLREELLRKEIADKQ